MSTLTATVEPKRPSTAYLYRIATLTAPSPALALDVNAVRHIRHWATAKAASWDVEEDGRATLELIASELVTNAILHTSADGRSVQVTLLHQIPADTGTRGLVWLEVRSSASRDGTVPTVLRTPAEAVAGEMDLAEHGRGMQLVAAFSTAWGVEPVDGRPENGHLIWAQSEGAWAQVPAAVA